MRTLTRRNFNRMLGAAASVATLPAPAVSARARAKVAVIGGGFGGATAAKYLKRFDPAIAVTLIEPSARFVTCPFSNTVIGGLNGIGFITRSFAGLKSHGVELVHDMAVAIDGARRQVTLAAGGVLNFDRCIVSPGIDFRWGVIEGLDASVSDRMPHAWKAGPQTLLLQRQLETMRDGGVFLISPPVDPFRCPPGPAERISLVAHYFKAQKPRSKIVVLDPKKSFSKQDLFREGWTKLYPGMIEYHNIDDDGVVRRVDAREMTLHTDFGKYKGDVINVIPPQHAGKIAHASGLADRTGWCPVDPRTFESILVPGVHVVGDSALASPMPKSGFSAATQAKVCAAAIAVIFAGGSPGTPKLVNACYSLIAPDYAVSIAMVYGYRNGEIVEVEGSGGLSPMGADASFRKREAEYADGWYRSICDDIWG